MLVAVAALVLSAVSFAAPRGMGWSAKLNALQEVPKQAVAAPKAAGAFNATLSGTSLKWKLTFSKLSGPATAAHIHMGAMGKAGGVVVALCGPCKSGQSGTAKVTAAVVKAFPKHKLYVNVHTAKNPAGEIRGQLGG
jgi:hypothetical protein